MRMFDLAAADPAIRFSPYCWRIKFAAAMKGLTLETTPWRFSDQNQLPTDCRTVPTVIDGDHIVTDSFAVASYLETAYPGPTLFGGAIGQAHARLINSWADAAVGAALVPLMAFDVFQAVAPQDRDYFRTSREKRFGKTLEQLQAERDEKLPAFRAVLQPARITLRQQPWLGGEQPSYADCILMGQFMWARCISHYEILAADDPLNDWRDRMLDLFGGLARNAPRV